MENKKTYLVKQYSLADSEALTTEHFIGADKAGYDMVSCEVAQEIKVLVVVWKLRKG